MAKTTDANKAAGLGANDANKSTETGHADRAKTSSAYDECGSRCSTDRLLRLAISRTGFIFDPQTGQSFTVNHTGLATLEWLRRGESPEETARLLSQDFSVAYELAASSVEAFLMQLWRYL